MYLYFKYPTDEELLPKLTRFFEPEDVPPILINRLVNEDSHGPTPENSLRAGIDPETIPVAKKILQLLQKDSEQYDAFMESISWKQDFNHESRKLSMNLIEMKYDKEPVFIFSVFQNISS